MPNLTSNLTIKLTDDLSTPAGKAAQALKKFGMSAADVEKAAKLTTLREAQANFRQATNTFQATQQTVKKLAQEFAAADNPTKQMGQALERARRQASEAAGAFRQQSAVFREARTGLQSLGVSLSKVASEEERVQGAVRRATAAMEHQAQRAQSVGARMRRGLGEAAGVISPLVGLSVLHGTKEAVAAGSHLQSEKVALRLAGIPAKDIVRASDESGRLSAIFPNLTRQEILERYKEARSVLLHPEEAMTELPVIAQANSVLKGMEATGRVGEGSAKGLGFALKGAEVLGVAQDPKRLRAYIDSFIKAKQVMGELITPEQIYDFATNVKSSGATLSDRFLHTTAMSLTGELRGMRAGTGVDQFVKQITGGFQGSQHSAAKEFLALGLLNKNDFETTKTGQIQGLKAGHNVAGYRLARSDPDKWVAQYLIPAMKQHGVTDEQEQLTLVKRLFTSSRAADIVSKLISQAPSFMNHAQLMREAMGLSGTDELSNDAAVGLQNLKAAFSNFAAVVTEPVMENAARGMGWLAKKVAGLSISFDMLSKNHPDLAKGLAGGAIVGGIAGGAGLTYYTLLRPLMKGFGLKSSALALDGSAAALTRAAIALGAKDVAGSISGSSKTAAPRKMPYIPIATALTAPLLTNSDTPDFQRPILAKKVEDETRSWRKNRDFTLGSNRTFGSNFGTTGSFEAAPARSPFPGGSQPADMFNFRELAVKQADAQAAGEAFANAFRQGASGPLRGAIEDAHQAVGQLIAVLNFRASPQLDPVVPSSGGGSDRSAPGVHGMFSDYGVAP